MRILLVLSWLFLMPSLGNFFGINIAFVSGQCQSGQQSLLLQMKSNLIFDSNSSVKLIQWSQSIDCCDWGGVDCDEDGRVVGLDLSNESISGGIENANALSSFHYLQSLNLSFNSLQGAQIPFRLANLTNLIYLNLAEAGFAGLIPIEQISSMTSLVTLDLSSFRYGLSPLKLENPNLKLFLQNLTDLRELYLDGVDMSAHENDWCQALSVLPNLQVLSLSDCSLSGPINPSLANLRSLSVIRLDGNNLSSPVPEFLADFSNLTSLHLDICSLYGKFPEKIFQVPTLETLDLSYNQLLQGSLPHFPKNHSLREMILMHTNFSGTLPSSIANLQNLSTINVAVSNFTGQIPASIANLTQLVYLDLSYNVLTGVISSIRWEQLLKLDYVDLSYNSLNGSIPRSLFELPLLQRLNLENNQFDGSIPRFSHASSSALDVLYLDSNKLRGPIPISVFKLRNLTSLDLSFNSFNGSVELDNISSLGNLEELDLSHNCLAVNASSRKSSFSPKLLSLNLASCKLREIPILKNTPQLRALDLSDNQISGEIPNWIWEVSDVGLQYLNLSHNLLMGFQEPYAISVSVLDLHSNQLQGNIHQFPHNAVYMDFSSNNFTSTIPSDIGNFMPVTTFFSAANNGLTGVIPLSLCNATTLGVLDLSNNSLSGTIPTCLMKKSDTLVVLNLRRNIISGTLPVTIPGNCFLQTLDLNGNQLEGMVPKSLANCQMLEVLDLGNNQISDKFPCWLHNASSLHVLVLRSNNFSGSISCPENNVSWPMLQIIDLASNRFSGRLPQNWFLNLEEIKDAEAKSQSELTHLQYDILNDDVYYQVTVTVTIKGLQFKLLKILSVFTSIDFSSNNFEGPIPEELELLKLLYGLNLSHNALTGSIPSSFGNLKQIESLDLSKNNLSGEIPSQLASLNFLSVLNLSYNHLVGKIPTGTQLQSFLPTSFEGNKGLCGPPLTNDCQTNSRESLPPAPSDEIDWFFIIMATGFVAGFGAVVAPLNYSMRVNKWYDDRINKFLNR